MNEYLDTLLDRINRIYRMQINPVNPVQKEYSDTLLGKRFFYLLTILLCFSISSYSMSYLLLFL